MIGLGASEPHRRVQRVKTAEEIVFGVLCLVAAFLQSTHIRFGVLTSYSADIACPAYLYLISRRSGKSLFTFLRPATPGMAAGCVFALSVTLLTLDLAPQFRALSALQGERSGSQPEHVKRRDFHEQPA
jgi:hypothetical protein